MTKRIFGVLLALVLVLSSTFAAAAQDGTPGADQGRRTPNVIRNPIFTDRLLDMDVWNINGNTIGSAEGLVINRQTGMVDYLLLSGASDFDLTSDAFVPVPWVAFSVAVRSDFDTPSDDDFLDDDNQFFDNQDTVDTSVFTDDDYLVLNVDDQTIENAPTIDPDNFDNPTFNDVFAPNWDTAIRDYWSGFFSMPDIQNNNQFNNQPNNQNNNQFDNQNNNLFNNQNNQNLQARLGPIVMTEDIDFEAYAIDLDVEDRIFGQDNGIFNDALILDADVEEVGEIDNLVIFPTGDVRYAVLEEDGFLGIFGGDEFAIPWNLVVWDSLNEEFHLAISQNSIDNAPGQDELDSVDFTRQSELNDLDRYWGDFMNQRSQNNQTGNAGQEALPATGRNASLRVQNVNNGQVLLHGENLRTDTRYAIVMRNADVSNTQEYQVATFTTASRSPIVEQRVNIPSELYNADTIQVFYETMDGNANVDARATFSPNSGANNMNSNR